MQWGGIMKKYKVIITRESYVEADNEEEAKIQAYDHLICSDVDFDVEEDKDEINNNPNNGLGVWNGYEYVQTPEQLEKKR